MDEDQETTSEEQDTQPPSTEQIFVIDAPPKQPTDQQAARETKRLSIAEPLAQLSIIDAQPQKLQLIDDQEDAKDDWEHLEEESPNVPPPLSLARLSIIEHLPTVPESWSQKELSHESMEAPDASQTTAEKSSESVRAPDLEDDANRYRIGSGQWPVRALSRSRRSSSLTSDTLAMFDASEDDDQQISSAENAQKMRDWRQVFSIQRTSTDESEDT